MAGPAVYIVLGHGSDKCDPVTHVPIREQLPAGVTVVERAVCGAYVMADDLKELADKIVDPANLSTIQQVDPIAIRSLLGVMGIHRSDSPDAMTSSIVKATITFLLDWVSPSLIRIEPSGLIAVPLRRPLPIAIMWTDPSIPLDRSRFLHMYSDSVYPTRAEMDAALNQAGIYGDRITWDMYMTFRHAIAKSEYFLPVTQKFPGVYYHIVCRDVDPICHENAVASRSASGSATGRTPEDIQNATINDIIVRRVNGHKVVGKLAAALPYTEFTQFFDKLIIHVLKKNPTIPRSNALCLPNVDLLGLMIDVMKESTNPGQYRAEMYKAIDECSPGLSDTEKDAAFEGAINESIKMNVIEILDGNPELMLKEIRQTIQKIETIVVTYPQIAPALERIRQTLKKLEAEVSQPLAPVPPQPAPVPPQPAPVDRPLQIGDRVRITNSDNPIRRAERFIILRRPLPTDLSSRGAKFGADVWMCEEVDSKKVVAIRETSLGLAPVQQGGALWPPKYYKGLSTRRKRQRHREITYRKKLSWKDPKAYRPFKTDRGVTQRKPSSYTSRFHSKYPGVTGIPAIAKATGVSADTLHKVYNRGLAAWRTGHRPGASQEAWGMARVYSFVLHGKTWRTADKDLANK